MTATLRQPLVAGNWKMHGTLGSIRSLLGGLRAGLDPEHPVEVAICPPFVYLITLGIQLAGTSVCLGAQNVSERSDGAYTGEISATMLRDLGCRYAIVGHSERRTLYGEDDALVAHKFSAALDAGLMPILCVGEQLAERQADQTESVVGRQLDAVMNHVPIARFSRAAIAYEPVWAIGTGHTATPDQAQQVHAFIRARIAKRDATIAARLRILYGGSVKGANAAELFRMPDIDGGLVGGASLVVEEFLAICRAA